MSERWSTRLPESMTLPKGEKHHFIIQCDSHPLSLSNMPYVPVTGRLAGLSSVTGLFTHCSQSDTISCRKKHHHSTLTGCQAEGTNLHGAESLPGCGRGQRPRVTMRDSAGIPECTPRVDTSCVSQSADTSPLTSNYQTKEIHFKVIIKIQTSLEHNSS